MAACALMPLKRNLPLTFAIVRSPVIEFSSAGCQAMTASTSLNTPSRTMYTLPDPPSSAGVPIMRRVPFTLFACIQRFSSIAAAVLAVPNR